MAVVKQSVVEPALVLPSFNFSPAFGPVGTPVTISGNALSTPVTQVLFNGVPASRFPDPSNPANLIAIVPQGATDGPVTLVFNTGSSITSLGFFDVTQGLANPVIRDFFPTAGPVGSQVQLNGSGFTAADRVLFGNTQATQFIVQGDVNIIAVVPSGAMDGPITVKRLDQSGTSSASFDVTGQALAIASFSPNTGVSGAQVSIVGSGFLGVDTVLFGASPAFFSIFNDGLISATAPAALPGTVVPIKVRKAGVEVSSGAQTFSYAQSSPAITSFSPSVGAPGTTVSINGNHLDGVTAVRFGGVAANFNVVSASLLTAVVPINGQDGPITVEANGVIAQSSSNFDVLSTSAFSVTSLSPSAGAAGTSVTIFGTGLTGADTVLFGSTVAQPIVQNDSQLVVTVPAGVPGTTVAVSVRKANQFATGQLQFSYTQAALSVASITANVGNGTANIVGAGFTGVDTVQFAGISTTFSIASDTQIVATIPAGLPNGVITVTVRRATQSATGTFNNVTGAPTISSFTPAAGAPGTVVLLVGNNFVGATAVKFGGKPANFVVLNNSQLTATVPADAVDGFVTVEKSGLVAQSSAVFDVISATGFSVTGITPNTGAAGALVTISGSGLLGLDGVLFGTTLATIVSITDTSVVARVPNGNGTVAVSLRKGTLVADGKPSFTYVTASLPVIQQLTPNPAQAGQVVRILGAGFAGVLQVRVGRKAVSFQLINDNEIQILAAAGLVGSVVVITATASAVSAEPLVVA